jgi:hypothetical protein
MESGGAPPGDPAGAEPLTETLKIERVLPLFGGAPNSR